MIYILDSSALIALFRDEKGADIVEQIVLDERNACSAHAINVCEVYYDFHRDEGESFADRILRDIAEAGIRRRDDLSPDFCRAASKLKSEFRRISLADCFGLTLASELGGTFVTADHHELDAIAKTGRFDITFIR